MNMPFDPVAWRELEHRAARKLSPNFADNVLRAARQSADEREPRGIRSSFAISAATAALCFSAVLFVHARNTRATSEQHLAAWQEISVENAALEPSP